MTDQRATEKVTSGHLRRDAYLYVRQSTLRQVMENTTSTDRQYGLRQRAVALGWALDQITVIDEDLGRSGASAEGRDGFQRLVADVGMGKAGIVIGLEVSRLARNNADWHRLLEICALTETLILDEDGLYDPGDFNDRLLLGLKGQMSEAELHLLKARLRGGQLTKARRGELIMPLPVGLVYDAAGRVVLDPDQGVRDAVACLFATFARTGSARATVKAFAAEGLTFPSRVQTGPNKGTLGWLPLRHHRVLQVLHNPRYAGAFAYGRRRQRRQPDGRTRHSLQPREAWTALIPGAHPGYLTWAQYEDNLAHLAECAQARGQDRRASPPREGPALLQGLVTCGRCGKRMTIRYHTRRETAVPEYLCQRAGIEDAGPSCARIGGGEVDAAIAELLLATVTPLALDAALAVRAVRGGHERGLTTARCIEADRADEVTEVDLQTGDDGSDLIAQCRDIVDRLSIANGERLGRDSETSRQRMDVGMGRAWLDADEHAIRGLVEVNEHHAALRKCFVRYLLEPLVQITISKASRENTDAGGTARARKATQQLFRQALLPQVGEIDGGHAVIDEETAEAGQRARQSAHVGGLQRPAQGYGFGSRPGAAVTARRHGGENGESGDADGYVVQSHTPSKERVNLLRSTSP